MTAKKLAQGILVLLTAFVLSACGSISGNSTPEATATRSAATPQATISAEMPNPAATFCSQNGGKIELRTNSSGVYGVCIFVDKSECDEWAYFRGTCQPGQFKIAPTPQTSN
jgi:hypothetical protein